jgi:hypothetical protein
MSKKKKVVKKTKKVKAVKKPVKKPSTQRCGTPGNPCP